MANTINENDSADIFAVDGVYNRSDCIVFHKTREAFGGLSNMATGYPVRVNSLLIPSTEALYQACRFPGLPDIQELIISQASPMSAKMKSKPHREHTRSDWKDVRLDVMKWCLSLKLGQHRRVFGALLLSTANKPIVEQSRKDRFWGAVPDTRGTELSGCNALGRLLVGLREQFKVDPNSFDRIEPPAIPNFTLLGQSVGTVILPRGRI